uniref:Cathepsin propeptide inhibitor domain-containing protein n=1 Tax=Ananas comosus var. bracteatus TaxID=296719 RepID=A0A6V7PNT2_ANACO|nr:unnamed protein product [Ananas comosus var. bracteatus]
MLNSWQTLTEGFNGMLKADRSMTTKTSMTTERNEEELCRMHEEWMVKFKRTYANAEEKEQRFVLFKESVENCDRYKEHNPRTRQGSPNPLNLFIFVSVFLSLSRSRAHLHLRPLLSPRGIMSNFWQTLTEGFNGMLKAGRSMTTKMSMTTERNEEELRRMHEEWMVKYEQTYANAEEKSGASCSSKSRWRIATVTKSSTKGADLHQVGSLIGLKRITRRDVSKPPNCGECCYTGRDVVSET